jgi:hypothetical protein
VRFHCRIGSCKESFETAAAANFHAERDHTQGSDSDCGCHFCNEKARIVYGSYSCLNGRRHFHH